MRKVIFIISLILSLSNGYSQTLSYSIEYGVEFVDRPDLVTDKPEYRLMGRLVFNDTFSFYYYSKYSKELSQDKINGKKVFHHSYQSKPGEGLLASGASFRLKRPVWILDVRKRNWKPHHESKTVLGYQCSSAISIDSAQDIVLAFYTTDLPAQFGPEGYLGLPGTVLEVFHSRYNRHVIATKITRGEFILELPENIPVLTSAQFEKIKPLVVQPTITIRKF